jgi:hypothetical protein
LGKAFAIAGSAFGSGESRQHRQSLTARRRMEGQETAAALPDCKSVIEAICAPSIRQLKLRR